MENSIDSNVYGHKTHFSLPEPPRQNVFLEVNVCAICAI